MPENKTNGWEIDLSSWTTMKPIREFNRVARSGDMDGLIGQMRGVIKKWPYAGDPSADDAYDDLTFDQWRECQTQVSEAVAAIFRKS